MNVRARTTLIILFLGIGLAWLSAIEAKGPPIRVEQAIPNEAEQGQQGLAVKIKGRNFQDGDTVHFLVTGTDDESQIDVLSAVYDPGTGDIDTVIDVEDEAPVDLYDIEVRRGGRGGKGSDLFRVRVKGDNGGGNSDHREELFLCATVVDSPEVDMFADGLGDYCHGDGVDARLESFEGRLRFGPSAGTKKNPSHRALYTDAQGCTDRACDLVTVGGMITTEREHQLAGGQYTAGDTVALADMAPNQVTRVEAKVLINRDRAFQYSTPNSDRNQCPTHLTAPLWLRCDGKVGSNPDTTCDQWTLSTFDLGPDNAGDGSGDAFACLDHDRRGIFLEDVVELDFTLALCVQEESC